MDDPSVEEVIDGFKRHARLDIIKLKVCAYWRLDPFKEKKPFSQWLYMFLLMNTVEYEDISNVRKPLAELSGEIAGGFFNPEGLKKYYEEKERQKDIENGRASVKRSSSGGSAVANTTIKGDMIVDTATGEPIMSLDALQKHLSRNLPNN